MKHFSISFNIFITLSGRIGVQISHFLEPKTSQGRIYTHQCFKVRLVLILLFYSDDIFFQPGSNNFQLGFYDFALPFAYFSLSLHTSCSLLFTFILISFLVYSLYFQESTHYFSSPPPFLFFLYFYSSPLFPLQVFFFLLLFFLHLCPALPRWVMEAVIKNGTCLGAGWQLMFKKKE